MLDNISAWYDALYLFVQFLAFIMFLIVALATAKHFKAKMQMDRFINQGMFSYRNNNKYFIGMVEACSRYYDMINKYPMRTYPHLVRFLMDDIELTPRRFNSRRYPLVIVNYLSDVRVYNNDPQVAHDIFNRHAENVEKLDENAKFFSPLIKNSIVFGAEDDNYRQKHKALSHAFS